MCRIDRDEGGQMNPSTEKRFQELLDAAMDSSCSDAQRQEFAELIRLHPELVNELVVQLDMHSLLEWQCKEIEHRGPSRTAVPAMTASAPASMPGAMRPGRRTSMRMLAAAATVLIAVASLFTWVSVHRRSGNSFAVGEIVEENLVVWSDKNTAIKGGKSIIPGRLDMDSGTLKLRFRSGATVTMIGPASLQIVSDMLLRLENGQATAHVPQWAKGFTIETADCEVIDLGTQFGIVARKGELTDVVVFEGEVDLKSLSTGEPKQRRLTEGEGARVTNQGIFDRIVGIRRDSQGDQWSVGEPIDDDAIISSIHDNIEPADSSKYYQITPRGLVDDARAYVDRPHQWNGLTKDGLPAFLRRADYVRTFNDYKYLNELEIFVELARPANVYIFFDDRVPAPGWLVEQYKDTGVDVGLDEGPWPPINPMDPTLATAVRAGVSVDNVFSVWHRRCERADTLILGAMGDSREARAIYGIAATPLD